MSHPVTAWAGFHWPGARPRSVEAVALIIIDMQNDFCAKGGWVDQLGEDVSNTGRVIAPIARKLAEARGLGLTVVHTREGHKPDLSDLHANKQWRTRVHGLGIGDRGRTGRILVRGEPGWQIVTELRPVAGEVVIDKPGKSSFHATDLEAVLHDGGITHLIIAGVTSDCCVQSTMRDGLDRGFACVLLADCTAAVQTPNHIAALAILEALAGERGSVADSRPVMTALAHLHGDPKPSPVRFPQVAAAPYAWPFDGRWTPPDSAVLLLGFDPERIAQLDAAKTAGTATKLADAARRAGLAIVHAGPMPHALRGRAADLAITAEAGNAFFRTALDAELRRRGIRNLVVAGLPTEGLMHATMRAANDMGFECLAVSDACKGTTEAFHIAQLRITTFGNGLFGTVASSAAVLDALSQPLPEGHA